MSEDSFGGSMERRVEVIGFGRRFVAYLIDMVIIYAVTFCMGIGVGLVTDPSADPSGFDLFISCLGFILVIGYFVGFWATSGQTPGKMAMGIKVISSDGSPVSWGKAVARYLGYIISSLVLYLGFIWIAFDAQRQGWHDKIAGTYVVRKDTAFMATDGVVLVPSDSSGSSIVVAILVAFFLLVFGSIVVIAVLLLLGPTIGDVFSGIISELEATPQPR